MSFHATGLMSKRLTTHWYKLLRFGSIFICASLQLSAGAQEVPSGPSSAALSAPKFSKNYEVPNGGGGVNLFSGETAFVTGLGAIAGRNGLAYAVTGSYSSNVNASVNANNKTAPTGAMGLGWTIDFPKIIVDTKNTGNREDDTYYFSQANSKTVLIRTGVKADGGITYTAKNYVAWSIVRYPANERWEVIDENGMKMVFGNKDWDTPASDPQGTLQWARNNENWLGPLDSATGAAGMADNTRIPIAYNLAKIIEPWGDALRFYYNNIAPQLAGVANSSYTRESVLTEIRSYKDANTIKDRLVLNYKTKDADLSSNAEYVDPHKLDPTGLNSYYQDRFETRYLDSVEFYKNNGKIAFSKTQLSYEFLQQNKGEYVKRILKKIQRFNSAGRAAAPATLYDYYANDTDANKGAIKSITSPFGSTTVYDYTAVNPALSQRELKIERPAGYDKVRTWIGNQYVVVMWVSTGANNGRATDNLLVDTYSWEGRWVKADSDALSGTLDWRSVKLVTGTDMFALLRNISASNCPIGCASLSKYHKDPYRAGYWQHSGGLVQDQATNSMPSFALVDVDVGEAFIVTSWYVPFPPISGVPKGQEVNQLWRWQGDNWRGPQGIKGAVMNLPTTPSGLITTKVRAKNNFFIRVSTLDTTTGAQDLVSMVSLNESGKVNFGGKVSVPRLTNQVPELALGDAFAILKSGQQVTPLNWPLDLSQIRSGQAITLGSADASYPIRIAGNTVGIGSTALQIVAGTAQDFVKVQTLDSPSHSNLTRYTYGEEFAVGDNTSGGSNKMFTYSVKDHAWLDKDVLRSSGFISAGQGTLHFVKTTINPRQLVGGFSIRNPDDSWRQLSMPVPPGNASSQFDFAITAQAGLRSFRQNGAYDFAKMSTDPDLPALTFVPALALAENHWRLGGSDDARAGKKLTDDQTLIAYQNNAETGNFDEDFDAANRLALFRAEKEGSRFVGPQSALVVSKITHRNGFEKDTDGNVTASHPEIASTFGYRLDNATMDPDAHYPRFNSVAIHRGGGKDDDEDASGGRGAHYGVTVVNFFNGLDPNNPDNNPDCRATGSGLVASDGVTPCKTLPNFIAESALNNGNSQSYFGLLDGMAYHTEQWNEKYNATTKKWQTDKQLATSDSFSDVIIKSLTLENGGQGVTVYSHPIKQISTQDSVPTTTEQTYYMSGPLEGFLRTSAIIRPNANQEMEHIVSTRRHALEVYGSAWPADKSGLTPVAEIKTTRVDVNPPVTLSVAASTYKDWGASVGKPGLWGGWQNYRWQTKAGSDTFNFSVPNADWTKGGEPGLPNQFGMIEERSFSFNTPAAKVYNSFLMDKDKRVVIARFSDARVAGASANASFWGMEDYEDTSLTKWTTTWRPTTEDAHTGKQALINTTGNVASIFRTFTPDPVDPDDMQDYVLSAWVKNPYGVDSKLTLQISATANANAQPIPRVSRDAMPANASEGKDWQYYEIYLHAKNIKDITAKISADNGVLVDDIRFGPAEAAFSASVFDLDRGLVTASLGTNGAVGRLLFDEFNAPYALIGSGEKVAGLSLDYLSRDGNKDVFNPRDPNSALQFSATEEGSYDDFKRGVIDRWTCTVSPVIDINLPNDVAPSSPSAGCKIADPRELGFANRNGTMPSGKWMRVASGSTASFTETPTKEYAARLKMRLRPLQSGLSNQVGISMDSSVMVVFDGYAQQWKYFEIGRASNDPGMRWRLIDSFPESRSADSLPEDWLLSKVDGRVLFFIGGKKIFDRRTDQITPSPYGGVMSKNLSIINVKDMSPVYVSDVVIVNQPIISGGFARGDGRVLQSVVLNGAETTVRGYLYNANGAANVAGKAVVYADGSAFTYRPQYMQRDKASSAVIGDMVSRYGPAAELDKGYTNDGGFSFNGDDGMPPPPGQSSTAVMSGAPGAAYSLDSPASTGHVASSDHGPNEGGVFQMARGTPGATSTSSDYFSEGKFLSGTQTSPTGLITRSLSTTMGEAVAAQVEGASLYGNSTSSGVISPENRLSALIKNDVRGLTTQIFDPRYFAKSENESRRDTFTSQFVYDQYDRVIASTNPNQGSTSIRYSKDGRVRFWQDAKGVTHYVKYDRQARPIESGTWVVDFAAMSDSQIEDARFPTLDSGYSKPVWRQRFEWGVDQGVTASTSFAKGRLAAILTNNDANNATPVKWDSTVLVYDALRRVSHLIERIGDGTPDRITRFHYGFSNLQGMSYPQALEPVVNAEVNCDASNAATIQVVIQAVPGYASYDPYNDVINADEANSANAKCLQQLVGSLGIQPGQRRELAAVSGDSVFKITYAYNRLGQLSKIGRVIDGVIQDDYYAVYAYGPNGELLQEKLNNRHAPAQITTTMRYNSPGWLKDMRSTSGDKGAPVIRYQESLRYEDARVQDGETPSYDGRIAAIDQTYNLKGQASSAVSLNFSYTYFKEGGLKQAKASGSVANLPDYHYVLNNKDAHGNQLVTGNNVNATYSAVSDRLDRMGYWDLSGAAPSLRQENYVYDENGNLTSVWGRRSLSFAYDEHFNKSSKILIGPHANLDLTYGASGERVTDLYSVNPQMVNATPIKKTYYRGMGTVPLTITTQSGQTSTSKHFVYGMTGLIAVNDGNANGGQDYFVLKNHLGSTVMVLRQDGAPTASYTYTPWGKPYDGNGNPVTAEPVVPFLFQGLQYLWQVGLYDNHARIFDPETRRFLAVDPEVNVTHQAYIAYANDPVNMVDPDGRIAVAHNHVLAAGAVATLAWGVGIGLSQIDVVQGGTENVLTTSSTTRFGLLKNYSIPANKTEYICQTVDNCTNFWCENITGPQSGPVCTNITASTSSSSISSTYHYNWAVPVCLFCVSAVGVFQPRTLTGLRHHWNDLNSFGLSERGTRNVMIVTGVARAGISMMASLNNDAGAGLIVADMFGITAAGVADRVWSFYGPMGAVAGDEGAALSWIHLARFAPGNFLDLDANLLGLSALMMADMASNSPAEFANAHQAPEKTYAYKALAQAAKITGGTVTNLACSLGMAHFFGGYNSVRGSRLPCAIARVVARTGIHYRFFPKGIIVSAIVDMSQSFMLHNWGAIGDVQGWYNSVGMPAPLPAVEAVP